MGVAGLATISSRFIEHGRAAGTPVAIVENGSRPEQRVVLTTLRALGSAEDGAHIKSPALVIVGEVAALAGQLHWFGKTPETWNGSELAAQQQAA